jgi:hypothetical protein
MDSSNLMSEPLGVSAFLIRLSGDELGSNRLRIDPIKFGMAHPSCARAAKLFIQQNPSSSRIEPETMTNQIRQFLRSYASRRNCGGMSR